MKKTLSKPNKKFYYYSGILIIIGVIIQIILNYVISPKMYNIVLPSSSEIKLSTGNYSVFYKNNSMRTISDSKIKLSIKEKSTNLKIPSNKLSVDNNDETKVIAYDSIMVTSDGSNWSQFYRFEIAKSGLYEIAGQYEDEMDIVWLPIVIFEEKSQNSLAYIILGFGSIFLILLGGIVFFTTYRKSLKYNELSK
jgi:hypothetical protein